MPQSLLEAEAYKVPYQNAFSSYSSLQQSLILSPSSPTSASALAQTFGFMRIEDKTARKGTWHRFIADLDIPNFPDGATPFHSLLAVYERFGRIRIEGRKFDTMLSYPVLRVSPNNLLASETSQDLKNIARNYFERPRFLARDFAIPLGMVGGIILGIGAGLGIDYLTHSPVSYGMSYVILGSLFGAAAGPALGLGVHELSESRARHSISNLGEYFGGQAAIGLLSGALRHRTKVYMQRELYRAVQKEDLDISPEDFLKLYGEMPPSLISLREREIAAPTMESEALERMVNTVHAMLDPPNRAVPLLS